MSLSTPIESRRLPLPSHAIAFGITIALTKTIYPQCDEFPFCQKKKNFSPIWFQIILYTHIFAIMITASAIMCRRNGMNAKGKLFYCSIKAVQPHTTASTSTSTIHTHTHTHSVTDIRIRRNQFSETRAKLSLCLTLSIKKTVTFR